MLLRFKGVKKNRESVIRVYSTVNHPTVRSKIAWFMTFISAYNFPQTQIFFWIITTHMFEAIFIVVLKVASNAF